MQHHRHLLAIELVYPAAVKRDAEHGAVDSVGNDLDTLFIVVVQATAAVT